MSIHFIQREVWVSDQGVDLLAAGFVFTLGRCFPFCFAIACGFAFGVAFFTTGFGVAFWGAMVFLLLAAPFLLSD